MMDVLTLLAALVLGSYGYTSALWRWCWRMFYNHYQALEKRVKALEDQDGKSND